MRPAAARGAARARARGLLTRATAHRPSPPPSPICAGVDFLEKTIELDAGESVKLMIWDTAGQEEFDALTASYYRGTGACALVFSTVDRASFEAVEKWKRKVEAECGKDVVMCLVQNKVRRREGQLREGPRWWGAQALTQLASPPPPPP